MGRCVGVRGVWEVGCWGCTHMAERVAAISVCRLLYREGAGREHLSSLRPSMLSLY